MENDDDKKYSAVMKLIERFRDLKVAALNTDDESSIVSKPQEVKEQDYETMSDGLAELLGEDDEEEELEVPVSVAPKVEQCAEPELKAMLMGKGEPVAVSKFVEQSIVSQSLKEYPAIKLTFKGTVSIAQLKLIQETMGEHGSLCAKSTEILTDRQLCVYFQEVEHAWAALKWIHNGSPGGGGLRDFGSGLSPVTADYLPVSKWMADYDDQFTIRLAFDGLAKYKQKADLLFKTLSRFGDAPPQSISFGDEYKFAWVRYKSQIDAEIAISTIDRAFFFGAWCRATKAQPVTCELSNMVKLAEIGSQKVHRMDVSIKNSNGYPLTRDSWKKLLTHVSEAGDVESLFGDGQGVIVTFKVLGDAAKCVQLLDKKKFLGKTLVMTKKFHIDQLK